MILHRVVRTVNTSVSVVPGPERCIRDPQSVYLAAEKALFVFSVSVSGV